MLWTGVEFPAQFAWQSQFPCVLSSPEAVAPKNRVPPVTRQEWEARSEDRWECPAQRPTVLVRRRYGTVKSLVSNPIAAAAPTTG